MSIREQPDQNTWVRLPSNIPPPPWWWLYFPGSIWLNIYICDGGTWMGSYGWLMLSVCRGPVQCGPARLEPLFTQPLRPDWEALFSHPGAFQRKPPAEAPRIRYTTLKTIHTASFPPARCVPRLHTHHIKNTEGVWNIPVEAACGMSAA